MEWFRKEAKYVMQNPQEQEALVTWIVSALDEGWYTWVVIICGNFLLWVNKEWECVPCIPELFEDDSGKVTDPDNMELCQKMDSETFDTRFSYFSLKIGLAVYAKLTMQKHILLLADDKYVWQEARNQYLEKWFASVPSIYQQEMEKYLWWEKNVQDHLRHIVAEMSDSSTGKLNDFVLSEKYVTRRYTMRKKTQTAYRDYYDHLWKDFTSCSLEIFHLLTITNEKKWEIFTNCSPEDKICVLMFLPDMCTSSAVQWWLAVSKTNDNLEVINVTQNTSIEKGIMMITKTSKWWVKRL